MPETSPITSDEREVYTEFDRERSLRLSRIVAYALGVCLGIALVLMLVRALVEPATVTPESRVLSVALLLALLNDILAVWLVHVKRDLPAALSILASMLITGLAFQATREVTHGLDTLVMAVFGVYIIVMALAGVLAGTRAMFSIACLTSICSIAVIFFLPVAHRGAVNTEIILACATVVGGQWLAAVLTFIASSLYIQTLHELGSVRVAYERAQRLDELKDQFITSVNHELRNPIMAMYNYVETARLAGNELSAARRSALLDRAVQVGDRVIRLLESILDARRLDEVAADFTPEAVNVRRALEVAAELVASLDADPVGIGERTLRAQLSPELAIWGDAVRLQQILTNLLSNAVKYSPEGSIVDVSAQTVDVSEQATSARGRAEERQMVEIVVRDHGHGIPPEQIPLLFERFVRLPRDLASTVTGNGLGLYLCRVLAEAMNGFIWVESTGVEGEGAAFHVLLPAAPEEAADVEDTKVAEGMPQMSVTG
ncbi:MAG TPA: HAMP domain-containing sensor histidine kinase [Ktedonobacterales bacterium]|jgi:signal transduction histidine kinase|nr:HAMP domain-containing sensor histidine kinase [Ktedonobacterales bacterium]